MRGCVAMPRATLTAMDGNAVQATTMYVCCMSNSEVSAVDGKTDVVRCG